VLSDVLWCVFACFAVSVCVCVLCMCEVFVCVCRVWFGVCV